PDQNAIDPTGTDAAVPDDGAGPIPDEYLSRIVEVAIAGKIAVVHYSAAAVEVDSILEAVMNPAVLHVDTRLLGDVNAQSGCCPDIAVFKDQSAACGRNNGTQSQAANHGQRGIRQNGKS